VIKEWDIEMLRAIKARQQRGFLMNNACFSMAIKKAAQFLFCAA